MNSLSKSVSIASVLGVLISYVTSLFPIIDYSNYGFPRTWVIVVWNASSPRIVSISWIDLISDIVAWATLSLLVMILLGRKWRVLDP
jgi:hypothetical protein